MVKCNWFLGVLRKRYNYYLIVYLTRFSKVYVFSNNKYALSKYRYKILHKHYFITSVRSTNSK